MPPLLCVAATLLAVVKPALAVLPCRTVHQFPHGTWVENLYVRQNGDLVVSILQPSAALYYVANPTSASPNVTLLANFASVTGVLGVTETSPGKLVTFGGKFSGIGVPVNRTSAVFEVDLHLDAPHTEPSVTLVTTMPEASFLNGMQSLPDEPTALLIADSTLGLVWRLDTLTAKYDVAMQLPEMAIAPNAVLPLGINGIRVHDRHLYWANSFAGTVYRIAIEDSGYARTGAEVETVVSMPVTFIDDMTTGPGESHTVWASTNPNNTIVAIPKDGSPVVVAGSMKELTVAGSTAGQFGRTRQDAETLYVTTCGGKASPVNGTETKGGSIVAIDARTFKP
jgi:hypothetical protein